MTFHLSPDDAYALGRSSAWEAWAGLIIRAAGLRWVHALQARDGFKCFMHIISLKPSHSRGWKDSGRTLTDRRLSPRGQGRCLRSQRVEGRQTGGRAHLPPSLWLLPPGASVTPFPLCRGPAALRPLRACPRLLPIFGFTQSRPHLTLDPLSKWSGSFFFFFNRLYFLEHFRFTVILSRVYRDFPYTPSPMHRTPHYPPLPPSDVLIIIDESTLTHHSRPRP